MDDVKNVVRTDSQKGMVTKKATITTIIRPPINTSGESNKNDTNAPVGVK